MNIDKYIKTPLASEVELLSYKLLLNSQITDAQETLVLIDKQLKKIELKKKNQIMVLIFHLKGVYNYDKNN